MRKSPNPLAKKSSAPSNSSKNRSKSRNDDDDDNYVMVEMNPIHSKKKQMTSELHDEAGKQMNSINSQKKQLASNMRDEAGKHINPLYAQKKQLASDIHDDMEAGKQQFKQGFNDVKGELNDIKGDIKGEMNDMKDSIKEELNDIKEQGQEMLYEFLQELLNGLLDGVGLNIDKIETPFIDMYNMPGYWKYGTYVIYFIGFIICAATLFSVNYDSARNDSFLSEDRNAGVCVDEYGSTECCEVPFDVSGTYYADSAGNWNTVGEFDYLTQMYTVTLSGFRKNNAQYQDLMSDVQASVEYVGNTKGSQRDYSWNTIAWSSYTYYSEGFQFFSSAKIGKMFSKPIPAVAVAGNKGKCDISITQTYQLASRILSIDFDLNNKDEDNCEGEDGCTNPCPDTLSPQGMGYSPDTASFDGFTASIDMTSVVTAIAVNYGITSLQGLQNFQDDSNREYLLDLMKSRKYITQATYDATSSYYSLLDSPTQPIYCTTYNANGQPTAGANDSASCLIRVGNMLFYPVINSLGYFATSNASYPQACNAAMAINQVLDKNNPANYYCNLFNFVIGLVNYPIKDNALKTQPTSTPTESPANALIPTMEPTEASSNSSLEMFDFILSNEVSMAVEDSEDGKEVSSFLFQEVSENEVPTLSSSSSARKLLENKIEEEEEGLTKANFKRKLISKYFASESQQQQQQQRAVQETTGDDDLQYGADTVVDNGIIFTFAQKAAMQLMEDPDNGDLYIPQLAYNPMIYPILDEYPPGMSSEPQIYGSLCKVGNDTAACSVISIFISGDEDRTISNYNYQSTVDGAYHNTLYNATAFEKIIYNPPVPLVYDYYSCVYSPIAAFVQATGLTFANTQLYIGTFMLVYMMLFMLHQWYNDVKDMPKKMTKRLQDAKMKFFADQIEQLKQAKNDMVGEVKDAMNDIADEVNEGLEEINDAQNEASELFNEEMGGLGEEDEGEGEGGEEEGDKKGEEKTKPKEKAAKKTKAREKRISEKWPSINPWTLPYDPFVFQTATLKPVVPSHDVFDDIDLIKFRIAGIRKLNPKDQSCENFRISKSPNKPPPFGKGKK